MKTTRILSLLLFFALAPIRSQGPFAVQGLCIAAPTPAGLEEFVEFIDMELVAKGINTLILRVDFNYAYESRPELREKDPLSRADIKKIVAVCKKHHINLIPQVNLLGHQSWAEKTNKLLEVYPEFDETPLVGMPEKYEWPNPDGLYCKSYCPLHPDVHKVVFDLVDEITTVFESTAFHAGMDEVFYLADENCPRCKGKDPAMLFAGEVQKISDHLATKNIRLWIWADRLLDGSTSGMGMWEASMNNTARAIDFIPKTVVLCDWHYERAIPTPAYFAMKGFDVVACPWKEPVVAREQVKMIDGFKRNSPPEMGTHLLGVMHTVWSPAESFLTEYKTETVQGASQKACLEAMAKALKELQPAQK
jgi:hypothetical protein